MKLTASGRSVEKQLRDRTYVICMYTVHVMCWDI